jgi:GntR family transcriptional regulator
MVCYISNTPGRSMQTWDQKQPIYQQLADLLAAQLLDGEPAEGEAMPSVRALARPYLLNPLTVNRALQALGDEGLLENRRGLGCTCAPARANGCKQAERERFLTRMAAPAGTLRRLGLGPEQLNWEDRA